MDGYNGWAANDHFHWLGEYCNALIFFDKF
jgi:hypothetical protein